MSNIVSNSPAVGWNMGGIMFKDIKNGVIANNVVVGGSNGIYVRTASQKI